MSKDHDIEGAVQYLMQNSYATICVRQPIPPLITPESGEVFGRNAVTKGLKQFMSDEAKSAHLEPNTLSSDFFNAVMARFGNAYEMESTNCLFGGCKKMIYRPDNGTLFGFPSV